MQGLLQSDRFESNKDAVLFCIQSSQHLVATQDEEGKEKQPALLSIFKELLAFCKRKVVLSAKDKVGVMLYDTVSLSAALCIFALVDVFVSSGRAS